MLSEHGCKIELDRGPTRSRSANRSCFLCLLYLVRFGPKADICSAKRHVRFTPNSDSKSGHSLVGQPTNRNAEKSHVRFTPRKRTFRKIVLPRALTHVTFFAVEFLQNGPDKEPAQRCADMIGGGEPGQECRNIALANRCELQPV